MSLQDRIAEALKEAMRQKNEAELTSLRLVLTGIKKREKELRRSLEDREVLAVISSQVRQGREAAEQYRSAGREDLAEVEERELRVLQGFLPPPLSEEGLAQAVDQIIAELGAVSGKDMGKVMKVAMARLSGRADGRAINTLVKARLTS